MKKLLLGIVFLIAIGSGLSLNIQNVNDISQDISLASLVAIANASAEQSSCTNGGPGSSMCSISGSIFGLKDSCQVTCQMGYYACCNQTFDGAQCTCVSNET